VKERATKLPLKVPIVRTVPIVYPVLSLHRAGTLRNILNIIAVDKYPYDNLNINIFTILNHVAPNIQFGG
jgi:hypothetical protein